MSDIFIATLGQRPEAITVALDMLMQTVNIMSIVIVHTDPKNSAIAGALQRLKTVLMRDYAELPVEYLEIWTSANQPLIDIIDNETASDYFRGIYRILLDFKRHDATLHVLIAGGRKAMSVYAALAATLIFRAHDRLWHVVSPSNMIASEGQFHIPPEVRDQVYLVDMPIIPARVAVWDMPPDQMDDPLELVARSHDIRSGFIRLLTDAERDLVLTLEQYPDWSASDIGAHFNIVNSTVNNHLGNIYNKMVGYLALELEKGKSKHNPKMKQMLLRLLQGRL
ncbi:MAG: CRISPR-associated ring nuclease [Chloroflexota bacterium]|nr:CRISPR-associated ring nuclease [Chloroflexota bacterium]